MKGASRFCCLLSALVLGAVTWGVLATPGTAAAAKALKRSPDGVWTLKASAAGARKVPGYALNARTLARILASAPSESAGAKVRRPVLSLPLPGGGFGRFRIEQSPIFSPALQKRYRSLRTYRGKGVDDPAATARLDVTPRGFHAQILSPAGTVFVDPAGATYRSTSRQDLPASPFTCGADAAGPALALAPAAPLPAGDPLRTYRLAVTATSEYTEALGGVDAARAQILTLMNRAVAIFENEVAVRFELEPIIFTAADDPFTNGALVDAALLAENQTWLDTNRPGLYDIGHVVTLGPVGGLAEVGVTCGVAKAKGATSLPNPLGDPADVDVFSHMIGHQFGAHHTASGAACGPERYPDTAYEPGSGSTLMSLAGLCGTEDVQERADAYFHTASFDEITRFLITLPTDGSCGSTSNTGNIIPLVDAGPDVLPIPQGTPFTLTATSSAPEPGETLTFCWEQFDLADLSQPPSDAYGPLFRSLPPTVSPARTFPSMADLLSGNPTPWEQLPMANRALTFRATVRDNRPGGGGVNYDTLTLDVSGEPFFITTPASPGNLECGDVEPLAWQVGGGSVATDVRALLSTDGGASFQELLASTPNAPGAASVTVPKTLTSAGAARIKLEAIGNVFFALSGPLTVNDTLPPLLTAPPSLSGVECTSPAGASPDIGLATVADLCDDTPTLTDDAPDVFGFGTTTVTYTATDDSKNTSTATQTVEVVDTTPPSIVAPPDITKECTSPLGTPVDLGTPVVSDVCDDAVTVTNNAPVPPLFPLGMTKVLWTAEDNFTNKAGAEQAVTIVDTIPPVLTLALSPTVLWPPNHKLVTIRATITVEDICDAVPTVRLVSVTSDEPDNGKGDGNTAGDIVGAAFGEDDREFELRAERSGGGDGRVYTVTYEARDSSGNTTTRMATVTVPHDQGK